jgi:hypothetical protein
MIEQLAGYFADFGEDVVIGTSSGVVIVDMPTIESADSLARDVLITAAASDFPSAAQGQAVTLRGVSYTVRTVAPDGSGLVTIEVTR